MKLKTLFLVLFTITTCTAGAQEIDPGGSNNQGSNAANAIADADLTGVKTFDDLVRSTGLDAGSIAGRLRQESDAAIASTGFAQIFCATHNRFEVRADVFGFSGKATSSPIDPLAIK